MRTPSRRAASFRVVTIWHRKSKMLESIGNPRALTVTVGIACLLLFLGRVSQSNLGAVCLLPARVFTKFELYRIFTAPFFHGGFLHILFNVIAWMILGRDFERTSGTLAALYTIFVLLIPLIALLHCSVAYVVDALTSTSARFECAVGLSGVLFALLVVNVELYAGPSVSVCGLFSMPSRWYPWALAAVLQLFSPGLSLLGHLSGIVFGYALALGHLHALTPSDHKLEEFEQNCRLTSLPLWHPVAASTGLSTAGRSSLPVTSGTPSGTLSERAQAGWSDFTAMVSGGNNADSPIFTGQGRALGGSEEPTQAGRVPPTSRLIQEAEEKTALAPETSQASEVSETSEKSGKLETSETGADIASTENDSAAEAVVAGPSDGKEDNGEAEAAEG